MVAESLENFEISKGLGFTIHGLGNKYRKRAQRMEHGDRVLFYVTQLRKWTLTATITSRSFVEHKPVWKSGRRGDDYPHRVRLAPDIVLDEEDYIDALILAPGLEYLKRWVPEDWPLAFYDKLHLLPQRDFALIEGEMKRIVSKRQPAQETAEPEHHRTESLGIGQVPADREREPAEGTAEPEHDRTESLESGQVPADREREPAEGTAEPEHDGTESLGIGQVPADREPEPAEGTAEPEHDRTESQGSGQVPADRERGPAEGIAKPEHDGTESQESGQVSTDREAAS